MRNGVTELWLGLLLGMTVTVFADPQVNITFGSLRGVWLKTKNGNDVAGFLGLPYAEPPVGNLRFENPLLWSKKWTGIRNATKDGSACVQTNLVTRKVTGSEDCLYLNVFTPTISKNVSETKHKNLSVLVFVHGGAFNRGSSNSSLFAPTYLLDYDIILVTLNYRLNVMGFFSTGNRITPGNYGLKDMVAALRWVKGNIAAFGGNPDSITLVGPSSAAASVQMLASSPKTVGLFHKIISMSGSPTATWVMHSREDIRNQSMRVARQLGCLNETYANLTNTENDVASLFVNSTITNGNISKNLMVTSVTTTTTSTVAPVKSNGANVTKMNNVTTATMSNVTITKKPTDEEIIKCVKKADVKDIVLNALNEVWRRNPECIFGPTLEPEAEGAVLTVHPVQSLKEGLFRDVPWITGVVTDEGLLKTTDLLLDIDVKTEFLQNFKKLLIPYVLDMNNVFSNATEVTQAIEKFYFNNSVAKNLVNNITQVVGDALITWPTYDFLQKRIAKMNSNAYFYEFAYEGTFSMAFRGGYPYRFGAAHYDDINYLFPYLNGIHADLQFNNTMGDITMINILCEMWTNFAKTGVPSARLTADWEPYQKNRRFMKLGNGSETKITLEQNFLPERMAFWDQIMKNFSLPIKEYRVEDGKNGSQGNKSSAEKYSVGSVVCLGISILCLWWSSLF